MTLFFSILWVLAGCLVLVNQKATKVNRESAYEIRNSFYKKWHDDHVSWDVYDEMGELIGRGGRYKNETKIREILEPYMEPGDDFLDWCFEMLYKSYKDPRQTRAYSHLQQMLMATKGKVSPLVFMPYKCDKLQFKDDDRMDFYVAKILEAQGVDSRYYALSQVEVERMITGMEEQYYLSHKLQGTWECILRERMKTYEKSVAPGGNYVWYNGVFQSNINRAKIPDWYFEKQKSHKFW